MLSSLLCQTYTADCSSLRGYEHIVHTCTQHTHKHAHTHACIHTHKHTHMHTRTHPHTCTCMHAHAYIHPHTHKPPHTHTCIMALHELLAFGCEVMKSVAPHKSRQRTPQRAAGTCVCLCLCVFACPCKCVCVTFVTHTLNSSKPRHTTWLQVAIIHIISSHL